ncbi:peptidyl-prolyl cis-trans isomerase, FKBP-type [Ostertagia ostertagi]
MLLIVSLIVVAGLAMRMKIRNSPGRRRVQDCLTKEGDVVDQFYRLTDKDGKEIGSNFGKKPYTFTLGKGQVIPGMERAMTGMCIGEKRKVVIPGKLGFGKDGRDRDNIAKDQTLYYTSAVGRPVPSGSW